MVTVTAHDLRKTFHDEARGEVHAVDGLSFEARQGEILGRLPDPGRLRAGLCAGASP